MPYYVVMANGTHKTETETMVRLVTEEAGQRTERTVPYALAMALINAGGFTRATASDIDTGIVLAQSADPARY